MKVSLKLIATYRQYLPPGANGNVYETEVPAGTTARELLAEFDIPLGVASVVLVNGRTPDPNYTLEEDDVVCAFPAVGGGQ
ncbi:MAG: MoaD/ThiS family protein [Anaerolineae bacterium]